MQKIACVFSFKESNWVSCQKIVFNLHKAYQACPETQLENFNHPHEGTTSEEMNQLAGQIASYGPDVISIMDHKPHPYFLLFALKAAFEGKKKPKIIFHLFGDFTLFYNQWEKSLPVLNTFKTEFVVASHRQKFLVDRMFKGNASVVCPFPVDPKEFHFDSQKRLKQRQEWKLQENDVVFLFTGRLSRQKRIKTLITHFAEVFAKNEHAHLFLYGYQDNIGDPFVGKFDMEGEYFRVFYRAYKAMPESIQKRIHFMGGVPNSELRQVYQGADVLVNLSVHNDEDYGMSVAEAQSTGLPSALTDWGGLASFEHAHLPEATKFIPVKIGLRSKLVSRSGIKEALAGFYANPARLLRKEISEAAEERFGIQTASEILNNLICRETENFNGFTELFYRASKRAKISLSDPAYVGKNLQLNQLYRDIYSAYVR